VTVSFDPAGDAGSRRAIYRILGTLDRMIQVLVSTPDDQQ
jgi:hypothetical protein